MPMHIAVICKPGIIPIPIHSITVDMDTYDYEYEELLESIRNDWDTSDRCIRFGYVFDRHDNVIEAYPETYAEFYATLNTP